MVDQKIAWILQHIILSESIKYEYGHHERWGNLAESQVDIPNDFKIVLNELASNNVVVYER